jgi:hypothetical protein
MIKRLILPLKIHGQKGKIYPMSYNAIFTLTGYEIYTIKKNYKNHILDQLLPMQVITDPVAFTFIFHKKDRRGFDLDNWGFCQAKMLFDSMQNEPGTMAKPKKNYIPFLGHILPDDTTKYIKAVTFLSGDIDQNHPHCECIIEKVKKNVDL